MFHVCQGVETMTGCQVGPFALPLADLPCSLFSSALRLSLQQDLALLLCFYTTERKALEITAHPKCTFQCLTGQLKGIATNVRFKPYTVYLNDKCCPHIYLSFFCLSFFLSELPVCADMLYSCTL